MALEEVMTSLGKSIDRLCTLMEKGGTVGGAATTNTTKTTAAKADKAKAPVHTGAEVQAILRELSEANGKDSTKSIAIIKTIGKVQKMVEIDPSNYDAVYDAAKAALEETAAGSTDEDDGM